MVNFYKNDTRVIRVEPNPFKKMKNKFKMKVKRISGGQPILNSDGDIQYAEREVSHINRVPGTAKKIVPGRTKTDTLNTGLDKLVSNPYAEEEYFDTDWAEKTFKGRPKVSLQHLLEYEAGWEKGYLTNRIPARGIASDKEDKKFFEKDESKPKLDGNVSFFYMNNPVHRVNYYTLLAHKDIANTYAEIETGENPDAGWYIVDNQEKAKLKETKIERETKAAAALVDLKETDAIIQMAKCLELEQANDNSLNRSRAGNIVYEYYNSGKDQYEQYMKYYELYKDASRRDEFVMAALLFDYIRKGVVSSRNGKYTWVKRVENEANELHQRKAKSLFIKDFLLNPVYSDELELIQEEYESKLYN